MDEVIKERLEKSAGIGNMMYSLSLCDGRISVYKYVGAAYQSMSMPGNKDDFDKFSVECPEAWTDIASGMMSERWGK